MNSTKRPSPPPSLRQDLAPQNNQIQLNHTPMLSHHNTIKSSSILPQDCRTNSQSDSSSITPTCSGTTKQSSPRVSLPNALVLHNNQIAPIDNQIPAQSLPHHKAIKSNAIIPQCSCRPQQPNRINRQSNSRSTTPPCSRTTKQSNPAHAFPNALVLQNNQIQPNPANNQIQLKSIPTCSHTAQPSNPAQSPPPCSRTTKQPDPLQLLPKALTPQNNQIQLNPLPMLSHHNTIRFTSTIAS